MNERRLEHATHAENLLRRLREANLCGDQPPSTSELQEARIYGLRPVNRLGDLRRRGHDIQMIKCAHSVNRWKLHEPPRPLDLQEWRNKKQLCLLRHAAHSGFQLTPPEVGQ
jgi:hypothetical protein